jgi:hypothetical protein
MLSRLRAYARVNGKLCFGEALLPTLASNANLLVGTPEELQQVVFRNNGKEFKFVHGHMYHPVKDLRVHEMLRTQRLSTFYERA